MPFFKRRIITNLPGYNPFVSLRIGGTTATAPDGDMDDFAVWNRELSRTEIAALYESTASIHAACNIP